MNLFFLQDANINDILKGHIHSYILRRYLLTQGFYKATSSIFEDTSNWDLDSLTTISNVQWIIDKHGEILLHLLQSAKAWKIDEMHLEPTSARIEIE